MNPIEVKIRDALSSAEHQGAEARGKVYAAAHSAILSMPEDHVEPSIQALKEAISNIEKEIVRQNKPSGPARPSSNTPPTVSTIKDRPIGLAPKEQVFGWLQKLKTINIDTVGGGIAMSLLVVIGLSAFTLGAFSLASSDSNAKRNPSLLEAGVTTLFSAELPSDKNKLTLDAKNIFKKNGWSKPVLESAVDGAGTATLYGRGMISVKPGKDYLMRVEFESKSGGKGPGVKAGFVAYDEKGDVIINEESEHLFFVKTSALDNRYLNGASGNYVLSGIASWNSKSKFKRLDSSSRKIRPVVQIVANDGTAQYRIRKITIEQIE